MRNKKLLIILFLGFLIVLAFLSLDFVAPRLGFNSGMQMARTVAGNYLDSDASLAEEIRILIDESDLNHLKQKRNKAIERGMLFVDPDSYVPAKVLAGDDTLMGEIRLKGHMLDHVKGDKWSYRIKLKDGFRFDRMKRFSLQHPGTRNYVHEWVFHQLLRREGIIALNYKFITLKINENDLGLYAVEEHFAEELLLSNNRPRGALVRFSPELYWKGREVRDIDGYSVWEEYSNYQCAFVEPYDRGRVFKDTTLLKNFGKINKKLTDFRKGKLKTSDVFDVEKMAKYHAIIDLLGGHHSLDWSDVKYYFNDSTGKIEPVGYESFSVHKTVKLCGMFNFVNDPVAGNELHKLIFSDPDFFAVYIKKVKEVIDPNYLDGFFADIEEDLTQNLTILNAEFPYKQFDASAYYRNQSIISKYLDIPQGMHGYFSKVDSLGIELGLGSINTLPIEIVGIEIDGKYQDINPIIMPSKEINKLTRYERYFTPLKNKIRKRFVQGSEIVLHWRLLGADEVKQTELFSSHYTYSPEERLAEPFNHEMETSDSTNLEVVFFEAGTHVINKPLHIAGRKNVRFSQGTELFFVGEGKLIVECPLYLMGTEESPIRIKSDNNGNKRLDIKLEDNERVIMDHVVFDTKGGGCIQNGGSFVLTNSIVSSDSKLDFKNAIVKMDNVLFTECRSSAVQFAGCELVLNQIGQSNCTEHILDVNSSSVLFKSALKSEDSQELVSQVSGQLITEGDCERFCNYSESVLASTVDAK